MADFGPGVSRVLNPAQAQLVQVVWQEGKPPLDAELNFLQQLATDFRQIMTLRGTASGFLGNDINANADFATNPTWSNWFRFGNQRSGEQQAIQWAAVNGWLIPVTGTQTGTPPGAPNDTDTWNRITLDPPPNNSGDNRIDFVFLEVWQARVPPNPSADNKPASSAIYRYGNAEGGYTFLSDDLQDPALGFETTQRVQLQYRIRVVSGLVGLTSFPDGFDPTVVKARGAATTDTAFTFDNMRETLNDPGLWRAGDGAPSNSLGSTDGYSYAVPIGAVFRRNAVAWDGDPGQNLNGAFNRNPTAIDRTGWTTFSTIPALAADIDDAALSATLVSASNISLPASPATPVFIKIGDEILTYSSITGVTMTIATRGALGTRAEPHLTGETIQVISGRPDGIFSDQIAKTDILDLRHTVNPNGFDYQTLLKGNLDKLLRGELRANWKRSGGGPQGPFVLYQDKISASAAALGVSKLDSPDNLRTTYSDSMVLQRVEFIATPPTGQSASQDITTTWGLQLSGSIDNDPGGASGFFSPGDIITIPVAQLKGSLPGADTDQAKFVTQFGSVTLRRDGDEASFTEGVHYSLSPSPPATEADDLVITLLGGFGATSDKLFITFHVMFGPSRGLSRRPDSFHSVAALSVSSEVLIRETLEPNNNQRLDTAWALLWSKYRFQPFQQLLPVTAGSYVDPGSRTVVVQPFRRIALPQLRTLNGSTLHAGSTGLMPENAPSGGAKWTATDPLDLFSNDQGSDANPNIYVILPRSLLPGWGAVFAPIRHTDGATFRDGINFGILTNSNIFTPGASERNYIPFTNNGTPSFTHFTTSDFAGGSATFNVAATQGGVDLAGLRFFNDSLSRNLGRKGLEMPPFYGIARLFAIYEADDWEVNGDAYDNTTRTFVSGAPDNATNLLRQDFEGPTFWIEKDVDGDSTFIINADAIDITKSPNAIANFESGHYVITANIFGFTRGTFDVESSARIVLTRERTEGLAAGQDLLGPPDLVVPGPAPSGTDYVANYSRTPYQGDPWGSQTTQTDIPHLQGPIPTQQLFNIDSIPLDEENLTRPEQKTVEVLASIGFATTLGTGRLSGDFLEEYDFLAVGREDHTAFPPATGTDPRPNLLVSGLDDDESEDRPLGTAYHGCTERLPLGASLRDANFRGNLLNALASSFNAGPSSQLVFYGDHGPGGTIAGSLAPTSTLEQNEVPVNTATISAGAPSDVLVHVDGEPGNYTLDTNFRTIRGGSVFTASGARPGGEVGAIYTRSTMESESANVLAGRAYLVRNTTTSVGATEVSAGDELMLLIQTTAVRYGAPGISLNLLTLLGTNGTGEGDSAADLYRIEGHPLVRDNVRVDTDPNTVTLSRSIVFVNDP